MQKKINFFNSTSFLRIVAQVQQEPILNVCALMSNASKEKLMKFNQKRAENAIIQNQHQNIIKIKPMNQLSYSATLPSPRSNPTNPPKVTSPTHLKTFDKTLPTINLKHYASNPNLSLDTNGMKTSMTLNDNNTFSTTAKRGNEYRSPPSHSQYVYLQKHNSQRPSRNLLTQSLIINDNPNAEMPEEASNPIKEIVKNPLKKQYSLSESIEDLPQNVFLPKRQELGMLNSPKDSNFYKKDSGDQKIQNAKPQIPSFLNRQRADMKRSQVVEPTFESNRALKDLTFSRELWPKARPRKVTVEDFTKLKQLGNGKYGRVYLVRQKHTNFICALKVIQKKLIHEQEITDQFIRQVKIQMFLNHPNIIKMYGCFHDAANIYIILEVGTGGQLYHQLKKSQPLSQPRIAFIMRQVCEAVNEIHSLKIIHRDIKPQNIVLHDNIIKLCDFGWSVHQDNKLRTTFCGTPLYVCPQILKGREYDQKIDIWSIGIMMYEMAVGENPFKITREEELIKIVKDEIRIPAYLFVSAEVRDFLDRCLQKNPNERASIKELVNHAFFKKHAEKADKAKVINM